jgi:hypothetical protein
MRTTVAVPGSCRAPPKSQAPADFISSSRTPTRSMNCRISSSVIGSPTSPSTLWTDNKYFMVVLLVLGGHIPPLTPTTNAPRPDRHVPNKRSSEADDVDLDHQQLLIETTCNRSDRA